MNKDTFDRIDGMVSEKQLNKIINAFAVLHMDLHAYGEPFEAADVIDYVQQKLMTTKRDTYELAHLYSSESGTSYDEAKDIALKHFV